MKKLVFIWNALRDAASEFSRLGIFSNAAALSYYTIFSLPPILLIVLTIFANLYDEKTFSESLFRQIGDLIGPESADQLSGVVSRLHLWQGTWWSTIIGIGTLLFTSTTVFVTIQNSLNKIFQVKPKPRGWGILKMIKDRLLSFTFVLGIGFILMISLVLNALLEGMNSYLNEWQPAVSWILVRLIAILLPLLITSLLFSAIYRFLPDAQLSWWDCLRGGVFTAILFAAGKDFIGYYIGNSQVASVYEAAGSVMVIMLWVFYASAIFLFGASFTAAYIRIRKGMIPPNRYAVKVVQKEIDLS